MTTRQVDELSAPAIDGMTSDGANAGETTLVTPMCRRTRSSRGRISVSQRPGIVDGREIPPDMTAEEVTHRRKTFERLMERGMRAAEEATGMTATELKRCRTMKYIPDRDWFFIRLAVEAPETN